MTFDEFFKEFCKEGELDVWNMSLETYNYYKKIAKQIFDSINK